MKTVLIALLILVSTTLSAQTFIDMHSPADASLIFMEVHSKDSADICVYKTKRRYEAGSWDFKWKFRNGGWSNFAVYIAKDPSELIILPEEVDDDTLRFIPNARIYFTTDTAEIGYIDPCFQMEGIMRKVKK